jgi:hypothetical protein
MKLIRKALAISPVLFLLVYSSPPTAAAGKAGRQMAAKGHYFLLPNKAITGSSKNHFTLKLIKPFLETEILAMVMNARPFNDT